MKNEAITFLVLFTSLTMAPVFAETQDKVYAKLPVKEVTIFKDGHAYVLHEGTVQSNDNGDVVLDELPSPIMGAFWAYSANPKNKLQCVISSRDEVDVEKTAMTIGDLLKSNIGKEILFRDMPSDQYYQGMIIRMLEEKSQNQNNNTKIVLVKTPEGIKALPVAQIQNITFLEDPDDAITNKVTKDTMTLKLDKTDNTSGTAQIGMAYIQKGLRWIPSYRVEINGKDKAVIKLQGTIINELADLEDVSAHLVIGVPKFTFQDTPDPISFQETIAQLSQHFRPDSQTAYSFSNAVMSQRARFTEVGQDRNNHEIDLGPELTGMKGNEDLFVFSIDHITLKKGQRMVLSIAEYTLDYKDIYTVDINFAPPLEMRRHFNTNQHLELAKLFHAPKAIHKIRLTNKSEYPLTTAPATIFKDGRVLAQGMMKFTSVGGTGDLDVTTALDIKVKNSDQQVNTTPNAINWNGSNYTKVDMAGTIELHNYSDKPVTIHVKRSVLGNMDKASQEGTVKQLGHGYDGFAFEDGVPFWWNWCSWPWWWYHFNSIGQVNWDIKLDSKEEIKLDYNWHYYWQ